MKDRYNKDFASQTDTKEYFDLDKTDKQAEKNEPLGSDKEAEKNKPLDSEQLKPIIDALNNKW